MGNVNEAISNIRFLPLDKIEHDIHGIVADVVPGIARTARASSQKKAQVSRQPGRSPADDFFDPFFFTTTPSVDGARFDAQLPALGALAQAENYIGIMLFDRVDELSSMKAHRKDDFFQTTAPG